MGRLGEKAQILKHVLVRGVVQGVGFRPFVYRLAKELLLKGWVSNTSSAVEIEVEGEAGAIDLFFQRLCEDAPPLARIERVEVADGEPRNCRDFVIKESRPDKGYQLISPDIATCPDCLAELFDPGDSRYRYPFINCTNCGPRFTIIKDIPYDRPKTTMAAFKMCGLCRAEYEDPSNRRFHAQPNACPVCGPRVWIEDRAGHVVHATDPISEAVRLLRSGSILAVKGLGGFQLACDACNSASVETLRRRKGRPDKPFALMMGDLDDVRCHCLLDAAEVELLSSPQAPIVLLPLKSESDISPLVAPENRYMGVMLPYTPLHHLLLRDFGRPLVMTSGNISEEPIAKDNEEAKVRLGRLADHFLFHDRDIHARYDDSVYLVQNGSAQPVRRARSYAPYPVKLPFQAVPLLAVGGEEKNTFCLTLDRFAFLSQHIGDLGNRETMEHFTETLELYKKLFKVTPQAIAHDLHPDYLSTRYARESGEKLPLIGVQHHHAHVASCMADNGLSEPVIGVAFDGSGFGPDGSVWGGEFIVATYEDFERVGHLERMPLPGGEISIRRPYRLAFAYVQTLLGEAPDLPSIAGINADERDIILSQMAKGINTPLTSSCGRLFDSVSALLGLRRTITFEGQAAIAIEMAAARSGSAVPYPFRLEKEDGVWQVKLKQLFYSLVEEITSGVPIPEISFRFHVTLADVIREVTTLVSRDTGITKVVLSGGCFQNRLLLSLTLPLMARTGLTCFMHRQVPCNDGGLALGQAAVAARRVDVKLQKCHY